MLFAWIWKKYILQNSKGNFFFFFHLRGRRLCVYQNMMPPATTRGPTASQNSGWVKPPPRPRTRPFPRTVWVSSKYIKNPRLRNVVAAMETKQILNSLCFLKWAIFVLFLFFFLWHDITQRIAQSFTGCVRFWNHRLGFVACARSFRSKCTPASNVQ